MAGQSKSAQEGFDKGYREGADYALQFGEALGKMIGLSKLELNSGPREEVESLVHEGNRLSQDVGKDLSKEVIEDYLRKCEDVTTTLKNGK